MWAFGQRTLFTALVLFGLMAMSGMWADRSFNSDSFMQDNEIVFVKTSEESLGREVASPTTQIDITKTEYVPYDADSYSTTTGGVFKTGKLYELIFGQWELFRYSAYKIYKSKDCKRLDCGVSYIKQEELEKEYNELNCRFNIEQAGGSLVKIDVARKFRCQLVKSQAQYFDLEKIVNSSLDIVHLEEALLPTMALRLVTTVDGEEILILLELEKKKGRNLKQFSIEDKKEKINQDEVKVVASAVEKNTQKTNEKLGGGLKIEEGTYYLDEIGLQGKGIFFGDLETNTGTIVISSGEINSFEFSIETENGVLSDRFSYAEIGSVNTFSPKFSNDDKGYTEVHGIITPNGPDSVIVRIASGKYMGMRAVFSSMEKINEDLDQRILKNTKQNEVRAKALQQAIKNREKEAKVKTPASPYTDNSPEYVE